MEICQAGNDIVIRSAENFNLTHTFECGQCFRWNRTGDNGYLGIAMGRALYISQEGNTVTLHDTNMEDYQNIWESYFDLPRDYHAIQRSLKSDAVLAAAMRHGGGIRILAQDPFEALVSFIISANNNIPRIKLIVERLCARFGEAIAYRGHTYYTFPSAQRLVGCGLDDLADIRAGFRDKYILDAARKVSSGEIVLEQLKWMGPDAAKRALMQITGVGEKVANCIVLFGLGHYGAFPVDVWIKRIINHYYFDGDDSGYDIGAFARDRFGDLGGFAQQYLFYYARDNKIAK